MAHVIETISHDFAALPAFARIAGTLQLWQRRAAERADLASFTSRDLQDIGLTCADRSYLLDLPIWRG
jgi:uncharacterized protein YjiS (DUF1127 family)